MREGAIFPTSSFLRGHVDVVVVRSFSLSTQHNYINTQHRYDLSSSLVQVSLWFIDNSPKYHSTAVMRLSILLYASAVTATLLLPTSKFNCRKLGCPKGQDCLKGGLYAASLAVVGT